jgi:hypothetical protein
MAKILEFRCQEEAQRPRETESGSSELPEGHSAEIVIFPGVRIERQPGHDSGGDLSKGSLKGMNRPAGRDQ